ncbi:MAG: hypothetical protein J2P45_19015, partial [Candidatus Dormibacteraeota bacterium]|nr:hypothetical protein [Candidatus Dormibacteraeota bacterium]
MPDDLILMEQGDALVALEATPYDAGAVLHDLVDAHPELLAGAQMDRSNPRRFVPLRHEALDGEWDREHLFLDQDGIPTIVEVVHSSDSAGRRDAVGRLVDYAANAGRTVASSNGSNGLRSAFHRGLPASQPAESEKLETLLGADADLDEFWSRASRNLRQGTLRLVLVADEITETLQAVIEFLNLRMTDTDVFGVEIRQYCADGAPTCYVPRLVGTPSTEEPAREAAAAEVEEVLAEAMPAEEATPPVAEAAPAAPPEAPAVVVPATPEEEELQDAVDDDEEEELQDDLSGEPEEEELQDSLDDEESEAVQLQNRLRSLAAESGLECK